MACSMRVGRRYRRRWVLRVRGIQFMCGTGVTARTWMCTKRLTLEGEGADVVTVTAADFGDHVFEVTADYVNISMFTVTGVTSFLYAGIYLDGVDHCNITENTASCNYNGIYLYYSSNNTLVNNTANSNNCYGIGLHYSSDNMLASNNASNNERGICPWSSNSNTLTNNTANSNSDNGIYLEYSSDNMLVNNTMSENVHNFYVLGYSLSEYIQNIDISNTVDGKPIYYWVGEQDKTIPRDAGFVGVVNCTNITVRDLTLTNNREGVLFAYTENSRIENVTVSNNWYGIRLEYSSNNTLASNNASDNDDGVWLSCSSSNTLTGNTASNNDCGIILCDSSNNTLANNKMSGNTYNFGVFGVYRFSLSEYTQNIDISNTVDGKPIYYCVDQKDRQIPSDAGFVGVVNCTNITARDMTLTNNWDGVLFAYTENSRIENVSTSNNERGIGLHYSNSNTLTDNTASNNWGGIGIYLYYSSSNTLASNTASNNYIGIYLTSSSDNNITCNLVQSNTDRAFSLCDGSTSNNISFNNIIESGNYNAATGGYEWQFENYQSDDVDACDNWWGTTDNDAINASIYDWNDDSDRGNVTCLPKLEQPTHCTPTPEGVHTFTTADAAIALQIAAGSRGYNSHWDVSGDNRVTSLDALMILQAAAGNPEVPSGGCKGLDQNVLRRYDHEKSGLIESNEMETAKIGYENNYEAQSDYEQILYAYEHKCLVEPK